MEMNGSRLDWPISSRSWRRRWSNLTAVTKADVLKELARLGFARMKKFSRVTAEGDAYLDMSELTDDDWAAVQEI